MTNVNEQIQDRTIRHMVYLERYKVGEIRRLIKVLNSEIIPEINDKIEKRLLKIIERGSDLGPETTARLKQLEKELTKLSQNLASRIKELSLADMIQLSADEIDWQIETIKKSMGFDFDMIVPNPRAVAKVIQTVAFAGSNLEQWYDGLARATQRNIMTAVNRGIVEGETVQQITRRISGTKALNFTDGIWQTTRNQVETVARSTINHVSNQSRLEFFKDNEDLIAGLKWLATLDSRTSTICAGLDGKVFPIDKGPRPPAHPNCRSTMTAVIKNAEELGLEIPEGKRSSVDGQVPASTTYGEWLKKQPVAVQNDVLGVAKAKLFRNGDIPIERFTSANLKPLNLEQLRQIEKKAFERAGL